MLKFFNIILMLFVLFLIGFGTAQFFAGNIEAGFSTLPFLLVTYLFVMYRKRT